MLIDVGLCAMVWTCHRMVLGILGKGFPFLNTVLWQWHNVIKIYVIYSVT